MSKEGAGAGRWAGVRAGLDTFTVPPTGRMATTSPGMVVVAVVASAAQAACKGSMLAKIRSRTS
jgi:hypothetical protein